jgi:hypothetical protein
MPDQIEKLRETVLAALLRNDRFEGRLLRVDRPGRIGRRERRGHPGGVCEPKEPDGPLGAGESRAFGGRVAVLASATLTAGNVVFPWPPRK